MAYHKKNYYKKVRKIVEVYLKHKFEDVPDTFIVKTIFPKNEIFISYRQWMNIKGMKIPKETVTK